MAADITPESMPSPDVNPGTAGSNSGTTSYKPDGQSGSPESSQTRGADSGTADAGRSGDSGWDSGSGSNGNLPEETPIEAEGFVEDATADDPLNHMKDFGDTAGQDLKDVQAAQGFVDDVTEDDETQGEEEETTPEKTGNFLQKLLSGGKSGISNGLSKLRVMTADGLSGLAGTLGVSTGVLAGTAGALGLGGFLTIFALLFGAQNYRPIDEYVKDCRVIIKIAENEARQGTNYDPHINFGDPMNGAKQIYSYFNTEKVGEILEYDTVDNGFFLSQQGDGLGCMAIAAIASVANGESGVNPSRYEFDYIKNYAFNRYAYVNWNEYTQHMFNLYRNGYIVAPSKDDYLALYSPHASGMFVEPTGTTPSNGMSIAEDAYRASDGLYYPGMGLVGYTGDRVLTLMLYADMLDIDDYRQKWNEEKERCATEGEKFVGIDGKMVNDNDYDGHADRMWAMDTQLAFMLAEWTGKISEGQDTDADHWGSGAIYTAFADDIQSGLLANGTWSDMDRIEDGVEVRLGEYPFVPHFLMRSCRDLWSRGQSDPVDTDMSQLQNRYGPFYPDRDTTVTYVPPIVSASELFWESCPWNFKASLCTDHAAGTAHKGVVYEDFKDGFDPVRKNYLSGATNASANWDIGTMNIQPFDTWETSNSTYDWNFDSLYDVLSEYRTHGHDANVRRGPAYPFYAYISDVNTSLVNGYWMDCKYSGYTYTGQWHEGHGSSDAEIRACGICKSVHTTPVDRYGEWCIGCRYGIATNKPYIYSQAETFMAMYVSGGGMDDLVNEHLELVEQCEVSMAESFWKSYSNNNLVYYPNVPQVVDYRAWRNWAAGQELAASLLPTTPGDVATGDENSQAEWKSSEENGKTLLDLVTRNICFAGMESRMTYYEANPTCVPPDGLDGIAEWAVSWAWPSGTPKDIGEAGRYFSINVSNAVSPLDAAAKAHTGRPDLSKMARCTEAYVRIANVVMPGDPYYSSCDRGAACAIRAAGADDNFPPGAPEHQDAWARQHTEIWQYIGTVCSTADTQAMCEPGDVLIRPEPSHIIIFVGGELAHEKFPDMFEESDPCIVHSSIGTRGPRLDKALGNASPGYHVYRCVNPMDTESQYKALLEGVGPEFNDSWDWGEEPTTTEDGGSDLYHAWENEAL